METGGEKTKIFAAGQLVMGSGQGCRRDGGRDGGMAAGIAAERWRRGGGGPGGGIGAE